MILMLLLALASAAAVLQVSLPLAWLPLDLPLLLAAFAGLSRGRGFGLLCGALAGAWLELLLGGPAGLRLLPLAAAGGLADALQPGINREQPRLQVLAVLALVLVHDALLMGLGRAWSLAQFGAARAFFQFLLPRLAAQALAVLPLFALLGRLVRQKVFRDPRHDEVRTIRRWP